MFENLNVENKKKFRKSILNEFADFLSKMRRENDGFDSTDLWSQLQVLKGSLFQDDANIGSIIRQIENIELTQAGGVYDEIGKLRDAFIALKNKPEYAEFISKDVMPSEKLAEPHKSILASSTTMFKPKDINIIESPLNINERLLQQMDNINNKNMDKSEAVRVLMSVSIPVGDNVFFIDLDKDIVSMINRDELSGIKSGIEKLIELEKLTDQLLVKEVDRLIEKSLSAGCQRVHIIYKTGGHYTPVDIDIENKSCLIMDAAQDMRRTRLFAITKYSNYINQDKVVDVMSSGFEFEGRKINGGALQKSEHGCWIFSLYHLIELKKMPAIHQLVMESSKARSDGTVRTVDWVDLPASIVCLSQSTTFLEYYKEKHEGLVSEEINALTNNNEKFHAYKTTIDKYKKQLEKVCQSMSEEEINQMIGEQSLSHKFNI